MIVIDNFKKHQSGKLYGFLDISVPAWNTTLHIKGCKVFIDEGKQWISLPSREYQNEEGETKYTPIIKIDDDETYKRFIKGIHDAWKQYCYTHSSH